jgi:hypothetical protein
MEGNFGMGKDVGNSMSGSTKKSFFLAEEKFFLLTGLAHLHFWDGSVGRGSGVAGFFIENWVKIRGFDQAD